MDRCDLVISNTKVEGVDGARLIVQLRGNHPSLPIVYLANTGRSTPEMESRLPPDVAILREPFTAERLRAAVEGKLDGKRALEGWTGFGLGPQRSGLAKAA